MGFAIFWRVKNAPKNSSTHPTDPNDPAQPLPIARLLHQPARRGRSVSALSDELVTITTGSGNGATAVGTGAAVSPWETVAAGSRTVDRRRDGSFATGRG